jgi:methylenetetrahydrofolate dehydrogenase (NADP+)/methenyltetrahydrofolate cyclohydrolase
LAATILDGNKIAIEIKERVAQQVRTLAAAGVQPGLAIILVGNNPASALYARNKIKACDALGIRHEMHGLPAGVPNDQLLHVILELNQRDDIDGIIIELPLPKTVDRDTVLLAVDPRKDIDGFHPVNVGLLATWRPGLVPCTAAGVMELLRRSNIAVEGAEAVIVGRSDIVGKPTAMLLLNGNATVTICHSRTRDLAAVCRRADILVAAMGRPGTITREFVKPGATVIDVGINKVTDAELFHRLFAGNSKRQQEFATKGWVLAGDVHPEVAEVAGAITPVPGGVGPLTIAMLMVNTVNACKMRRGLTTDTTKTWSEPTVTVERG